MEGLAYGVVKANSDKEHPGMLQVTLPAFAGEGDETFWARVTTLYAGKEYGLYFLPEVGDAVLVGFIQGDPQTPVVLGSFWNNTNPFPPDTVTENNEKKALVTKGGARILISEGPEGGLTVLTKGGHTISFSDKEKKITLATSDGKNSVVLDENKSAITIESGEKLNLKAKEISIAGKMLLKGSEIAIEADAGLSLKGKTVNLEGNATKIKGQTLEATGAASLKVESSAVLTLKGALTKIN